MKLLDEDILIKENLLFSLNRYTIWWLILVVTMVYDYLTTTVFVSKYGTVAEANIVTRMMMEHFGSHIGNFLGKIFQLVSVAFFVCIHRRFGNFFLLFVILINCWAIVMNSLSIGP